MTIIITNRKIRIENNTFDMEFIEFEIKRGSKKTTITAGGENVCCYTFFELTLEDLYAISVFTHHFAECMRITKKDEENE